MRSGRHGKAEFATGTRKKIRGFTLVEMLVSLTIGSLLVVSTVSATRALAGARRSVDLRMERAASARRALEEIVAALRNVRRDPIRREPIVVGHRGGNGGSDRIDLLVISEQRCRIEGAESDQYEVSFYLSREPGLALPVLICRKNHAFDNYPAEWGIASVVAEGIVALSFEYLRGREWQQEWSELSDTPPDAVRVTVSAAAVGGPEPRGKRLDAITLSTVVALGVRQPPSEQPRRSGASEQSTSGGRW